MSVHSTAVGKVLLTGLPDAAVAALAARTRLPARTPHTLTSAAALLAAVAEVRDRGWALDDQEEETGVRCLAVPVLAGDQVVAALSVSGPVSRVPARPSDALLHGMQRIAAAFSAAAAVSAGG